MRFIDREEVARRLTYQTCIPIVRRAMIALARGQTKQLLRSLIPLSEGRIFGIMPGAMGAHAVFGAKLISVFHDNFAKGIQSHQGLIILFDPQTGAPVCVVHAGEVTAIRTAAASAVATDALARADASRLALLGYGEQAATHARAIAQVRALESITVWGRSPDRARAFTQRMQSELGLDRVGTDAARPERSRRVRPAMAKPSAPPIIITAPTVQDAVADADIICTLTSAYDPILKGAWVRPGTHVNVVGSSYAGPAEIDNDLVVRSRFIADSRESVLQQGAEFLRAKASGLINDDHIAGEIGQVLAGEIPGRCTSEEITVYKSLGHVVQDLSTALALYSEPE